MAQYDEELVKAGVLITGEGLGPSSKGALVKLTKGEPTVIDGPFAEAKELIAGFTMIDVRSKEEALEWTRRWPAIDLEQNVELELRPLVEMPDVGTGEGVERHLRLRQQVAKKQRRARSPRIDRSGAPEGQERELSCRSGAPERRSR